MKSNIRTRLAGFIITLLMLTTQSPDLFSQETRLSLWTDPLFSWFSSDTQESQNSGIRAGLNIGLGIDHYFRPNYALSTGIFLTTAGGNMVYSDTVLLRFKNSRTELVPGDKAIYRLNYLTIPVGIKLRTHQIGYLRFYSNIGLDTRVAISRRINIPAQEIKGESVTDELSLFNIGYHIHAGIEYSLGGSAAFIFGLGYENSFFDVTKDKNGLPDDRITQNLLLIKMGIAF